MPILPNNLTNITQSQLIYGQSQTKPIIEVNNITNVQTQVASGSGLNLTMVVIVSVIVGLILISGVVAFLCFKKYGRVN